MRLSISLSEVRDSWASKLPRCSPDIPPLLFSPAGDPDSIWNSAVFDVEGSFAPRTVCGAEYLRGREAFSLRVSSCIVPSPNSPQSWDYQIVSRIIEFASPETDIKGLNYSDCCRLATPKPTISCYRGAEMSAMAEFYRYPLRVQQSKLDGWWFIFVDEVPGLGVVGPNFEDLLGRLKVLAGNLFRARGESVAEIEIVRSENPALHVFY